LTSWIDSNLKYISIALRIDPVIAIDGLDLTGCPTGPLKVSRVPGIKCISRGVRLKHGVNFRGIATSQSRPFIAATGAKNLRARIVKMSFGCGTQVFRGN
jgi:hypothetical protein